jgi:hypothetical protein
MPKYVVSSTLEQPEWTNSAVVKRDDLVEEVSKLKQEADGDACRSHRSGAPGS